MSKFLSRLVLPSVIAAVAITPQAHAQTIAKEDVAGEGEATDQQAREASSIVVIGSRRKDRSITDSAVAIDVIQPEAIVTTGYTDLNDALRSLVPAINVKRLQGNDGSSFVRPVTLRGSPPDHVLLLLNGKRRHRSAIVQIGTGHATTSGSQGQDFNVIPPIAFSSIQVLRDGASAQYGSDAIAGVVNLTLKDDVSGGSMLTQVGQYYDVGGRTYDIQGHYALGLGATGYLNLSAQYTHQAKTWLGGLNNGAEALRDQGVADVPINNAGNGEPYYEAVKTVWNAGVSLGGDLEAYMFGNYMRADSSVTFFYRQSMAAGGLPAHSTYADSAFDNSAAYPGTFDLRSIYPGGFTPEFAGRTDDFSTVVGIRDTEGAFNWDLSARLGNNKVDYSIYNTINPSLGAASPTSFKPGSLTQREVQLDAEASYAIANDVFAGEILVFGGASYRKETYKIGAGDAASYSVGPLRDLPVGSNGFQGFSPDIAGSFTSSSYALFAETDVDLTDSLSLSVAGRYEDYEQFGSNFSYKAASRFELSDLLAIRGSISTGFRAPAAGQLFGSSQTSQINAQNEFILDAVLIPGSPAAKIFGSDPLKPETSFNMSAGIVITGTKNFLTTIDFYQIDVDDRLLLTPSINTTAAQRAQLAAIGFPNGASVQQVRYFQNKLNTRVRGFDIVSTYRFDWGNRNSTNLSLAVNYNEQKLRTDPTAFFGAGTIIEFERGLPRWRGNLTATNTFGDFSLMTRANYYGSWKRRNGNDFLQRDPAVLFDAEITYSGIDNIDLSVGARNLFNKFPPDRGPGLKAVGLIYDNHSVFGVSGGFYYLNAKLKF
ncbi:TonB-dependent receptor [Sphingorhabdus soli]|uniref:TonB-dependent receptor n=1 Tax=Flavisphingopyxis soli TaxID=2601267 RepID=A0A5C6UL88_9SPHN|nr:TonB-dependent receptor [Sphingorhabdus soli]TXC73767.1 TonB-dependent receptor [Sphingorhabdus soli]